MKVKAQTCRQTTCMYNAKILPKVFPKGTSSDTRENELACQAPMPERAIVLVGTALLEVPHPGFRIVRNIENNELFKFVSYRCCCCCLLLLFYFCTKYKEPCRPFGPLTFRCVHGSPVAHDPKKPLLDISLT